MRIAVIQCGAALADLNANLRTCGSLLDQAAQMGPDLVLLNEMATTPAFAVLHRDSYFDWAEPLKGPSVGFIAERAKGHGFNVVFPFFEKDEVQGVYYNSAAVIGRDGCTVPGVSPEGQAVPCYRKTHLPNAVLRSSGRELLYNEAFYFRPGPSLPVFKVDGVRIGILICVDRSFPEAWRVLTLRGAQVVLVPSAIPSWDSGGDTKREELFVAELRVRAMESGVFVAASNKCGTEVVEGNRSVFFGASCIIDPYGTVLTQAPVYGDPTVLFADIDLDDVTTARRVLPFLRMRRPELYGAICSN